MISAFNPHPGHVVASLDKTLYDDYLCLAASNKLQIHWTRIRKNPQNHPASFGSSKYAVIIVIFSLLGSHCKDNHQIQKDSSLESFFSNPEFILPA